jgi:hypothetical protein
VTAGARGPDARLFGRASATAVREAGEMAEPDGATLSDDGAYYWDGQEWQPIDDTGGATPVDVVYQVTPMTQPAAHACWATAFAVLINYRDGSNLTPADVSNAVGVDISDVESWQDVTDAASHFDLHESGSACMDVQAWARLLADNGPLWICVHSGSHAVVLSGVHGDGTPEGTTFYFADPLYGSTTTDVTGLDAMFEAIDARQPGDGLIIWHR